MTGRKRLGATIRHARESVPMSQGDLASAALISRQYVNMIEGGSARAGIRTVRRIADALDCERIAEIDAENRLALLPRVEGLTETGRRFRAALIRRGETIGDAVKRSGVQVSGASIASWCRRENIGARGLRTLAEIAGVEPADLL